MGIVTLQGGIKKVRGDWGVWIWDYKHRGNTICCEICMTGTYCANMLLRLFHYIEANPFEEVIGALEVLCAAPGLVQAHVTAVHSYLHCFIPTRLLNLVVNYRLVLCDPIIPGPRKYRFLQEMEGSKFVYMIRTKSIYSRMPLQLWPARNIVSELLI